MLEKQSTYQSKVFRDFKRLDRQDYAAIVRFYETRQQELSSLSVNEHIVVLVNYTNALFEIAAYEKHLNVVDDLIEQSIYYNVQYYQGEDIYLIALYQKASSYFFLKDYNNAQYIITQLIKINPKEVLYQQFLSKCLFNNGSKQLEFFKMVSILFTLSSLGWLILSLLIINNFYPAHTTLFNFISLGSFLIGFTAFVFALATQLRQISHKVKSVCLIAKKKK